jgi:hypothetical protein
MGQDRAEAGSLVNLSGNGEHPAETGPRLDADGGRVDAMDDVSELVELNSLDVRPRRRLAAPGGLTCTKE